MNCKNCNAVMKADMERKLFVCPYCESTEPFDSVSKKELEGMLHDAIRDVRKESIKEAKKQFEQQKAASRNPAQKALDTFVFVLQVIFCVILGLFSVTIFTEYVGLGVISLLQLVLMITGMVMKSKFKKTGEDKFRKIKTGCFIAVGVLVIFWIAMVMNDGDSPRIGGEEKTWPTQGLGSELPQPGGKLKSATSSTYGFSGYVANTTKADFDAYVDACKEAGYTVDAQELDGEYTAYHETTDNKLNVHRYESGGDMYIKVENAIVMNDKWPTSEIASLLPNPEVETCCIASMDKTHLEVYVGDMTHDQFIEYLAECERAGIEGRYDKASENFYQYDGSQSINIDFIRGRIMHIRITVYDKQN
ncbi:MAG: hypothetical protein J5546_05065 [Lachnospiraceae bacterium]|nr:hypothetical protein [Lachnospiraceae bacterium]